MSMGLEEALKKRNFDEALKNFESKFNFDAYSPPQPELIYSDGVYYDFF